MSLTLSAEGLARAFGVADENSSLTGELSSLRIARTNSATLLSFWMEYCGLNPAHPTVLAFYDEFIQKYLHTFVRAHLICGDDFRPIESSIWQSFLAQASANTASFSRFVRDHPLAPKLFEFEYTSPIIHTRASPSPAAVISIFLNINMLLTTIILHAGSKSNPDRILFPDSLPSSAVTVLCKKLDDILLPFETKSLPVEIQEGKTV